MLFDCSFVWIKVITVSGDEVIFQLEPSHLIMALFGSIGEFLESQESWAQYTERLEQFFIANDIQNEKKASILLSTIGPAAFRTIGNLVAPAKPADETYAQMTNRVGCATGCPVVQLDIPFCR